MGRLLARSSRYEQGKSDLIYSGRHACKFGIVLWVYCSMWILILSRRWWGREYYYILRHKLGTDNTERENALVFETNTRLIEMIHMVHIYHGHRTSV